MIVSLAFGFFPNPFPPPLTSAIRPNLTFFTPGMSKSNIGTWLTSSEGYLVAEIQAENF